MKYRLPAPAKLNLFLNVTGRRADGYHDLQTVFRLLDFGDELTFETVDDGTIDVRCPGLEIDQQVNLVYRAAALLRRATQTGAGIRISVEKRIPHGAGLGGGSSDAATTLIALNHLWSLGLDRDELAQLGLQLGADVPVFVHGRSAWAEGVGEHLVPISLPPSWYIVIYPGCVVSTPEIFGHPELTRNGQAITIARFLGQGSVNVLEPVVRSLYPAVDEACKWLGRFGPAKMSGSGSAVYLPLDDEAQAHDIRVQVPDHWIAFVARGVDNSPLNEWVFE